MNLNINQTESKRIGCVVYANRGENIYMVIYDIKTEKVRLLDLSNGSVETEEYNSLHEIFEKRNLFVVESASLSVVKY